MVNTPASALTELCTQTDQQTHRRTDRWADSSIPLKTFILQWYKIFSHSQQRFERPDNIQLLTIQTFNNHVKVAF